MTSHPTMSRLAKSRSANSRSAKSWSAKSWSAKSWLAKSRSAKSCLAKFHLAKSRPTNSRPEKACPAKTCLPKSCLAKFFPSKSLRKILKIQMRLQNFFEPNVKLLWSSHSHGLAPNTTQPPPHCTRALRATLIQSREIPLLKNTISF